MKIGPVDTEIALLKLKKETTEGKIYSSSGKFAERAKKTPPKGARLWSRDLFKFLGFPTISPERWFARWWFSIGITNCPLNGRGHGGYGRFAEDVTPTMSDVSPAHTIA